MKFLNSSLCQGFFSRRSGRVLGSVTLQDESDVADFLHPDFDVDPDHHPDRCECSSWNLARKPTIVMSGKKLNPLEMKRRLR